MGGKKKRGAFTLVEILIGSLIVVVIAGIGGAGVIFNQSLIQKERYRVIALEYGSGQLEQLLFDTDFEHSSLNIGGPYVITNLPASDVFWTQNTPSFSYTVSWYPISGTAVDLTDPSTLNAKLITLTISWQEKLGQGPQARTQTLSAIKLQ